ncbi:MAG: YbaK/EbsC family protein [Bacillota bacterium]
MSLESVKQQFKTQGLDDLKVIELGTSSATVQLAAEALGVEPARIAKTMVFRLKNRDILVLSKGDARIDNRKYKDYFKEKAKMLQPEEVYAITGHPVGGVCPFGLKTPLPIYLDKSLQQFDYVFPAGGSPNSAVKITVSRLQEITGGEWADLCS